MTPSLPAVINQLSCTALKLAELTGYKTILPFYSCLFALKVIILFILNPCGFLLIVEIFARPSTVAKPIVSALLSRAID
jgi:hypothetical protein